MNTHNLNLIGRLSDQQLLTQVKSLAQTERETTAALIAHLTVLDERSLYLGEGFSSLFTYCMEVLHLSEAATYKRIEVTRAVRLTRENHKVLLTSAKHMRKSQVQGLVAAIRPLPPVPSAIRKLPTPREATSEIPAANMSGPENAAGEQPKAGGLILLTIPPQRQAVVQPLAPDLFKVQFTASANTREKLKRAQDLLRHEIPDGDLDKIVNRALSELLAKLTKQKLAETDKPRDGNSAVPPDRIGNSRHIPADVKRKVWKRDGGQCAFVAQNGHRCTERAFLEYHHVVPYAAGGQATVENIELRCRAHNGHEANLYFGYQAFPRTEKADRSNKAADSTRSGASSLNSASS